MFKYKIVLCLLSFILAFGLSQEESIPIVPPIDTLSILEVNVVGFGKSMDRETAFRLACQEALQSYLSKILPQDISKKMKNELECYLAGNFIKYFTSPPKVESWDGWEMKISGKIDHERLITDTHQQIIIPDIQNRIAIIAWPSELSKISVPYSKDLQNIAQTQIENTLKKYGLEFTSSQRIKNEIDREIKETGMMATTEESSFLAHNKSHFNLQVGLTIDSLQKEVFDKQLKYWQVKLAVEIYPYREKNKIFSGIFPPEDASYGTRLVQDENDSRFLLEQVVAKVSHKAGQDIAEYLKNYRPLPKTRYTIYFAGFSRGEKVKILRAFDHLLAKRQIDELQRGTGGGDSLKIIIDTTKKINALQDIISTYCLEESVQVILDPSRQDDLSQTFYYMPKEQE